MPKLEYIKDVSSILGEGCVYNKLQNSLYWLDIKDKKICIYNTKQKIIKKFTFNKTISSLAFTSDNNIIATTNNGFEYVDLENQITKPIIDPEHNKPNNRFNDGKCDKHGRYFAGTMDNDEKDITGSLYFFDGNKVIKKEKNLFISNGLGWNSKYTKFYLTDSPKGVIYKYDYDIVSAKLSNKKVFATINSKDGFPDGLTVDSDDYIWSAHWDGWKITRYKPTGEIDRIIDMPVPRVTCCCFGGDDNSTLFITTAKYGLNKKKLEKAPLSGHTFMIKTNVVGQKVNLFKNKKHG